LKQEVEQKTAETILQKPEEVVIGGETYAIAPPTTATLIAASELIAELPQIRLDGESVVSESLFVARDCRVLGDILATFILGARVGKGVKRRFWGLVKARVDNRAALSEKILNELSPRQINSLLSNVLSKMETDFFFGTIIFLVEVNMTRATKTTASGQ
jgi:hypothetical protein